MRRFGRLWVTAAMACGIAVGTVACGSADPPRVPSDVRARLPLHPAQLYDLCPVTDLLRSDYEKRAGEARRLARALIREVERRPDAVIDRVFEDAHSGERIRERLTVLELAEKHLREPGIEGAPCARTVMAELRDAVARARGEEPPDSPAPVDEPVFLIDEVAAELRLRQRGGVYRNAHCREVQAILTSRQEVEVVLEEPIRAVEVITVPERTVAVEVFRPTPRCRAYLERRLQALVEGG